MKDDRLSQTDELAEILNVYRAGKARKQTEDAEQPNTTPDLSATVVAGGETRDFSMPIPTQASEEGDPLPKEILSHLSEAEDISGEDGTVALHFTDADPEQTAEEGGDAEAEEDEDEYDDPYAGLSLPKRILKRIWNFLANSTFLVKALVYVVVVLIISAYLSYYVITIGNDLFALVTGSSEVKVSLPADATEEQVADLLVDKGLVDYKWVFKLFMQHYGDGEPLRFIPGEHTLNTDMNYSQLLTALTTSRKNRRIVTLTFPEGFTVDEIIDLFLKNGVGTREGFVEAINSYPYKHEFVQLLEETGWSESRVYRLEGYLYPDTYDFYTDTEEYLAINKLLNNFYDKVWVDWKSTYAEECAKNGYTLDDIVTIASMVEAEGKTAEDFEFISYVFHNRLRHSKDFPKLESDATIQYAYELAGLDREQDSSLINIGFDSPYNTYLYDGLPPGAICNAGLDAILAAIYPDKPEDVNAFYFVSNNAGKTYYAATLSGHQRNKERVKRENEAMANEN